MATFLTAQEAAERIPDGATVGLAGMGLSGWPEEVACAIRDRFRETGHPRNLNLKQGSAMGDWGYGNQFLGWGNHRSPVRKQVFLGEERVVPRCQTNRCLIIKYLSTIDCNK